MFTYSIVVADNDREESAEPVVSGFAASSRIPIVYCVEPKQNIPLARNRAIQCATGDFVALIDDDEFPIREWLVTLLMTCIEYDVDGVLGPVKRYFDEEPPRWIRRSQLFERATIATGSRVEWRGARTGNVLFRRGILQDGEQPFRPEFRAGEDQDFFRRMIANGHTFVWCAEAVAYEVVPPVRWKRKFILRHALLRGATAALQPTCGARDVAKSLIAVPLYTVALPFAALVGQHKFMTLLVKLCDHTGKLLAAAGINPIKEPYVTE